MSYLCVPIFVVSAAQLARDAAQAAEAGADLLELRIDRLTESIPVPDLPVPWMVTCRPAWEGGESELPDEARIELLESMAASSAAYIDLELATFRRTPQAARLLERSQRLILSHHDFRDRPQRLHNLVIEMNQGPAAINKIAWTARSIRDNLEALELLQTRQKPTIALCMGEAGLLSRVLAKKFGGFLTFASLGPNRTAPGQPSIDELKRLYRWDAIGAGTRVFGVVADPVAHSMSPAVHNAAFEQTGYGAVYLPMLVNGGYESFKAFMESFLAFESLDLSGLSVTIPHKENALRYLREKGAAIDELAERIGAVNTIVIDRSAGAAAVRGLNTDYGAILDSITAALSISRESLRGYRVAVIGAGGTGRTAVAALAQLGATVVVYNRTPQRASALAQEFDGKTGKVVAAPIEKLCNSCCQIYINTTSLGMHPGTQASPFGDAPPRLGPDTLVFDAVYNPPQTRLLEQARMAGAKTVSGVEMFVRQASAQFEAWTGLTAPTETMRRALESRLHPG